MHRFLPAVACLLVFLCLIACGGTPEQESVPAGLKKIPRERTLIMDCGESGTCTGQIQDYNTFNPYLPGTTSRIGYNFLYEPLYFYNPYKDELIPWIATGHEYSADYTELTIQIRPGVQWSDGLPWTAHDLVFTIDMLKASAPDLTFSTDMENWVERAVAVDSLTARIELTAPNPRFLFTYFAHYFGNGVPIVPRHIWEGRDPRAFTNFAPEQGLPVVSGPYQLALSVPEQRIWDLRDDWWAAQIGFQRLPRVERVIYLTYMDETKRVQNLIANAMDTCLDLRPPEHPHRARTQSQSDHLDGQKTAARVPGLLAGLPGFQQPGGTFLRPGDPPRHQSRHRPPTADRIRLAGERHVHPASVSGLPAAARVYRPDPGPA